MKRCKLVTILITVLLLSTLFSLSVFAEESAEQPTPELVFDIKYTSDSVHFSGISYETYVEPGTLKIGFEIVKDLPMGYTIYDSADTPYIDGIRVNGSTVESLKMLLTEDVYTYTIDVKIVYVEGILGDLASMSDGTYDWAKLLSNPLVLLQGVYFALAIISIVSGIISAFIGKSKKVKTADEIASKVQDASEIAISNVEQRVTECVISEVMPIVQKIFDDVQNIVKAITLSTSKSKDAPLALLDTLKESANVSTSELIDKIQATVKEHLDKETAAHADKTAFLQELSNYKPESPVEDSEPQTPQPTVEHKSIF